MGRFIFYEKPYSLLLIAWMLLVTPPSKVTAQSQVNPQDVLKAHAAWLAQTTPGVTLVAREVHRSGATVQYHLFAKGLPLNGSYQVITWPVTAAAPSILIDGASIGRDGVVMCAGRDPSQCGDSSKEDDPIEFTFNPTRGEPFRLGVVSPDAKAAIVIVPNPVQGRDKGCSVSVVRLTPNFELAYLSGTGFPPESEVQFETQSYGEKHSLNARTDASGNLRFGTLPFVVGHTRGTTTMKAVGAQCSPTVKFDWGG